MHRLVQRGLATARCESRDQHDAPGRPAYAPKVWLTIVLVAYARGIISARKLEPACREHMTCMALAGGMAPDPSPMAALVASMQEELVALVRAMRLVWEEPG
jgi:transposase